MSPSTRRGRTRAGSAIASVAIGVVILGALLAGCGKSPPDVATAPKIAEAKSTAGNPIVDETRNAASAGASSAPRAGPTSAAASAPALAPVRFVLSRTAAHKGETVDLLLDLDVGVPLASIRAQIAFDPLLFRYRGGEEIDYSTNAGDAIRGRFSGVESADRTLTLSASMGDASGRMLLSLAQFEALQSGAGAVEIRSLAVVDNSGRLVPLERSNGRVPVVID